MIFSGHGIGYWGEEENGDWEKEVDRDYEVVKKKNKQTMHKLASSLAGQVFCFAFHKQLL